jgi:hypothetical protein
MRIRIAILLIILSIIPVVAVAGSTERVAATTIQAEINSVGAAIVLRRYYDTSVWAGSIMPGIESASAEWLSIAQQLSTASDAGASEDIALALYDALAVNPFRVLPVLKSIYGGTEEERCTISFEAEIPKGGVTKYIDRIKTKLGKAKTKPEKAMAVGCLRGLENTQRDAKTQGLIK